MDILGSVLRLETNVGSLAISNVFWTDFILKVSVVNHLMRNPFSKLVPCVQLPVLEILHKFVAGRMELIHQGSEDRVLWEQFLFMNSL
jgi:hypothetical protein